MLKRFSGQEVFIVSSAFLVLLFMYIAIIVSAPINELSEIVEQGELDFLTESNDESSTETTSSYALGDSLTGDKNE
ncbi:hypothetical protein [Halalkalibacter akibai]|uniref:Uncharacterized protein n=1 Tax=Halalkalibacter akibai (strain ATCC 43226 / DSM 21942 / CIP 109018 / JCM 9157 / 1139) TaxID=1236973 RepID=W4QS01_HALA3|nr:hypothetical protein [Halalkalibacter akibai]GAE34707.1 hypothetical protein JCM9157_1782 [Halalkalibacter akibai JCM 9157]